MALNLDRRDLIGHLAERAVEQKKKINLKEQRGGPDDPKHPVEAPVWPPDPKDSVMTIPHRLNDMGVNIAHARNHMINAMKALQEDEDIPTALWNLDHAQRHMFEIDEISTKLALQVEQHPALKEEYDRLQEDDPIANVLNR